MGWILVPEYISAVYIAVYIINSLADSRVSTLQNMLFRLSLYLTLASTLVNIAGVYALTGVFPCSYTLNVFINTAYFVLTYLMITVISVTLLAMLFEENPGSKRRRNADLVVLALLAVSIFIIICNLQTGWVFAIDAAGGYVRGPINGFTYWLLLCDAAVVLVVTLLERTHIRKQFMRMATALPFVTAVMAAFQYAFPEMMLTGSIAALVLTVLLVYGQQQRTHIDHLTGLASREMFYQTLERFALYKKRFHVIFISLRLFKVVNNRFGQLFGDELLRQVGVFLQNFSKRAVACRCSGVEFALILPYDATSDFNETFERLCARFNEPWLLGNERVTLSAAIVEIGYPEHAKDVNELIGALEYAARRARARTKGSIVRFSKLLRNDAGRFYYVLSQLAAAKESSFRLMLQPVHDCKNGLPVGAEVLLRLLDENGRIIMPGEFIPMAEETGRISDIDWLVIEKTCALLAEHPDLGADWLSVNITPLHNKDTIVKRMSELLEKYNVPRSKLKLEVTERVFTADLQAVNEAIASLRALGVGVYLDDFGTGYSNLYQTCRTSFECIKIDKAFVQDIENDEKARGVLQMLIAGFSQLHAEITVEGVETKAQRDIVRRFGADRIQGFYYAKPMELPAFIEYVKQCIS